MTEQGLKLGICISCGAAFFPPRLVCPCCGRDEWRTALAADGTVEETTTVRRSVAGEQQPTVLATVRLEDGQRVIAQLPRDAKPGTPIRLQQIEGAVYGSRK